MHAITLPLALAVLASTASAADVDAVTLLRLGLSPETLAASGVNSAAAAEVVDDVDTSEADLASADAACDSASRAVQDLAVLVRKGNATDQQKADYQQAKTTLAAAEAARTSTLDSLFNDGVAGLTAGQKATLSQLRANMGRRGFATELLVVSRTDAQWIALRHALEHEKVCLEDGEALHPDVSTLLATTRSAAPVTQAKANLASNLASVKSAWDAALD